MKAPRSASRRLSDFIRGAAAGRTLSVLAIAPSRCRGMAVAAVVGLHRIRRVPRRAVRFLVRRRATHPPSCQPARTVEVQAVLVAGEPVHRKTSDDRPGQGIQYFNSIGLNHELFSPVGTDAFSFNLAGVPASGVLTGQDCCKTQGEVDLFGGYTGNYEGNIPSTDGGCVDNPFLWCDNLSNNDPKVLTFMSKGFANMVVQMAFDKTLQASSGKSVNNRTQAKRASVLHHVTTR